MSEAVPATVSGRTDSLSNGKGPVRNQSNRPPGRIKTARVFRSRRSALTARIDAKAADSCRVGSISSCSKRPLYTSASAKPSCRTASRRKAAFLTFDSTIVKRRSGIATLRGIAGEPPPEPMSSRPPATGDARLSSDLQARNGSMTRRSMAKSESGSRDRDVKLIRSFHLVK